MADDKSDKSSPKLPPKPDPEIHLRQEEIPKTTK